MNVSGLYNPSVLDIRCSPESVAGPESLVGPVSPAVQGCFQSSGVRG